MIETQLMESLRSFGTHESEHTGRSLLDHLLGVYHLLQDWNNSDIVCLAGLFHSIYGTVCYHEQSVSPSERKRVQGVIGEEAEELAYLFCACDREQLVTDFSAQERFRIWDRFRQQEVRVSEDVFRALGEIHLANIVEQVAKVRPAISEEVRCRLWSDWEPVGKFVSERAYLAFCESLHGRR